MAMDMSVALKISAGVTGQQAVDQLRTSMDKLNGAAASVGKGFDLAKTAVGAFIGLQAAQGVLTFARETLNAADQLDEMAERTGIAVETLSELDFAAKMNGKSLEDVQSALNRVAVKATDAATGSKTAGIAFDALGVSVKNADGSMRTSLEITEDIGQALKGIQDPTLKAALAVEIFGKQGPTLVPLIENMQAARDEARELGGVVGAEFAAQAAEFNDNMDRLTLMAKGFAGAILSDVLPALSQMFKEFGAGIQVFGSFGSALWNIGTTNPFKTPAEQAEHYFNEIGRLEGKIRELDATGNWYDRRNANRLRAELERTRKLSEYFDKIAGVRQTLARNPFDTQRAATPAVDPKKVMAALNSANATKTQTEAEKEATRIAAERARVLEGLTQEVQRLTRSEDELTIAKLRQLGATPQEIAQAQQQIAEKNKLLDLDRQLTEAEKEANDLRTESKRKLDELKEAGKRVYEETRTPLENLNIEMARLNDLLAKGVIDWDTYARAVLDAQDDFDALGKKGEDTMADLKSAIEGWGRQAADTFVEFAFTGKATFTDFVNSVLKDIARMLIYKTVTKPLFDAIGSTFGFANGGIMTDSGPVPLKAYANGGIANSPQLALFGEGRMPEAYVPLPDGRTIPVTMTGNGGGSTNVVVNVNMQTGQDQTQGDAQGQQLGRIIAGAVKAELINQKRPGGLLAA